jgi:hypothetical protein
MSLEWRASCVTSNRSEPEGAATMCASLAGHCAAQTTKVLVRVSDRSHALPLPKSAVLRPLIACALLELDNVSHALTKMFARARSPRRCPEPPDALFSRGNESATLHRARKALPVLNKVVRLVHRCASWRGVRVLDVRPGVSNEPDHLASFR